MVNSNFSLQFDHYNSGWQTDPKVFPNCLVSLIKKVGHS